MKKIIICALMMLPFIGFSQKKESGKIYIEHPAIDAVGAFTKLMVIGDTTAMAKMLADDFRYYNMVVAKSTGDFTGKTNFLRGAKVWQEQIDYYSIKPVEGTYPDAFEWNENPNKVTVEAWDQFKGAHFKTGVKADMIMHRAFEFNKDNKITSILHYANPEIGNEIGRGYSESKNGTIYNQHENINNLRVMMAAFEHGDMEKYYSFFDKSATFLYGSSTDITPTNLAAQKVSDKATLGLYEFVSIEQSGYPDYMHYEIGDSGVVYSWWDISLIRKSDKKAIKLPIHYAHDVNKEGKFVNTTSYYNPVLLE
jgi:hypothetical protein